MAESPFLARFGPQQRTETLDSIARQILAPLPAAYSSERLRAYPALRFPGLPTAPHDIAPMLPVVGCGTRSAYRRTHFFHRRRSRSLSLSQVWRTNEGHRTAHCRRNPTSFSTTDQLCGMKPLSPTPTLRALPRATFFSAFSPNRSLRSASSTTLFKVLCRRSQLARRVVFCTRQHSLGTSQTHPFPQLNLHRPASAAPTSSHLQSSNVYQAQLSKLRLGRRDFFSLRPIASTRNTCASPKLRTPLKSIT
jgi:hypothetical protein